MNICNSLDTFYKICQLRSSQMNNSLQCKTFELILANKLKLSVITTGVTDILHENLD